MLLRQPWITSLAALLLSGCVLLEPQDGPPKGDVELGPLPDLVPKYEPKSRNGNPKSYQINGQTYLVLPDSKGFIQRGTASWYGSKFHGNKTSNGEVYDMMQLSAAHKTLPIPTYLKVTNLENNRSTILRVNDRGPFHSGRIIDLSYAAAHKLGFADSGTAKVEIRAIQVPNPADVVKEEVKSPPPPAPAAVVVTPINLARPLAQVTPLPMEEIVVPIEEPPLIPSPVAVPSAPTPPQKAPEPKSELTGSDNTKPAANTPVYLQLGAFGRQENATSLKQRLEQQGMKSIVQDEVVVAEKPLYRLRIGPISDPAAAQQQLQQALSLGVAGARLLTATPAAQAASPQ